MKKTYTGDELNYVGFPLGGLGAGSFCVEGTGAFSAFSLKNEPISTWSRRCSPR